MCNKLENYQYIVDCNKHGESVQSKYHDLKIGRYGSCKLCWWETKYVDKIKSKSKNFIRFLEPVFSRKQKVKAECKLHGIYENIVSNIVQAKTTAGCEKCRIELNKEIQRKKSYKDKTHKKCNNCGIIKEINQFHKYYRKKINSERIQSVCIDCANKRSRNFGKKYRQTEAYLEAQNRYKQTDKYKLYVKNRLIKERKIKYIDIFLYKCKCCESNFYNKDNDLKYCLCLKCNTNENQIKFYDKYTHTLKDCICSDCGKSFEGKKDNTRCNNCRNKAKKEFRRRYGRRYGRTHKDRAKYFGCYYEKVDKIKVFERDKYICKECGIKCNPNQHYNKRDYPTLGHIVPLSLKGSHTYANVQCECRNCKELKNNKIINQQLTIFYNGGTI